MSKFSEQITFGCINAILAGKTLEMYCEKPVVQFLGHKDVFLTDSQEKGHQIIIWDGEQCGIRVIITRNLYNLITDRILKPNSLIRLDGCAYDEVGNPIEPVIAVCAITIIVPGDVVGGIINVNCSDEDWNRKKEMIGPLESLVDDDDVIAADNMAHHLTSNCLQAILRYEFIKNPVVQYLGSAPIPHKRCKSLLYHKLVVTDGSDCSWGFMLAPHLRHFITDGKLTKYSLIRLDECRRFLFTNASKKPREVVLITKLSIVMESNVVGGLILIKSKTACESVATKSTENSDGVNDVRNQPSNLVLDDRNTSQEN